MTQYGNMRKHKYNTTQDKQNTRQHETTQVKHKYNLRQHKYITTQHEYNTSTKEVRVAKLGLYFSIFVTALYIFLISFRND